MTWILDLFSRVTTSFLSVLSIFLTGFVYFCLEESLLDIETIHFHLQDALNEGIARQLREMQVYLPMLDRHIEIATGAKLIHLETLRDCLMGRGSER